MCCIRECHSTAIHVWRASFYAWCNHTVVIIEHFNLKPWRSFPCCSITSKSVFNVLLEIQLMAINSSIHSVAITWCYGAYIHTKSEITTLSKLEYTWTGTSNTSTNSIVLIDNSPILWHITISKFSKIILIDNIIIIRYNTLWIRIVINMLFWLIFTIICHVVLISHSCFTIHYLVNQHINSTYVVDGQSVISLLHIHNKFVCCPLVILCNMTSNKLTLITNSKSHITFFISIHIPHAHHIFSSFRSFENMAKWSIFALTHNHKAIARMSSHIRHFIIWQHRTFWNATIIHILSFYNQRIINYLSLLRNIKRQCWRWQIIGFTINGITNTIQGNINRTIMSYRQGVHVICRIPVLSRRSLSLHSLAHNIRWLFYCSINNNLIPHRSYRICTVII